MDLKSLCFQLSAGQVPEWVPILPIPADGVLAARDGRRWSLKDPAKVVANTRALKMDLPWDYEHQTDLAASNGQPAPAAGWIKEIEVRDDAIWARVEWTDKARAMIQAGEYRYYSPVFMATKKAPHEITRILRVALTNDPALEVKALTRREDDPTTEEETMTEEQLKALCKALGLKEGSSAEEILKSADTLSTAVAAAKKKAEDGAEAPAAVALAKIAKSAGLQEGAEPEAVATAVSGRLEGSSADFVPRVQFDELAGQLTRLVDDNTQTKATTAVDQAMAEGKVVPAARTWALDYAKKNPEGFAAFCKAAPVVVKPGAQHRADPPPNKGAELDDDELAVCRQLGITPEAYKKARDEEVAR
ncbi:Mu-like prophage I protein [Tistlia consotensis]|uniref:Mu-like prophage I protein n=1 Tax=Tistlia consotensis USBA 355 TaxID=560819 RepID=A0A1Y6CQ92_9PROT|nr:phage protease [Tistlia consotensis]SMF83012.1 Mu-like prophage I protein [Tistlia consotensis USBA 355]SNS31778.1 Mu-like prophage I protein [Tistlia consotensis]